MGSPGPQQGGLSGAVGGGRSCPKCGTVLAADNTARLCGRCLKEHTDQLSAPPELQDGFFETDDLRAAFVSRHIGKVSRRTGIIRVT
jgi:hypothetical protein